MKVMVPVRTPYREVDPADVLVVHVDRVISRSGLEWEAWGVLESERRVTFPSIASFGGDFLPPIEYVDGPEYRVAYKSCDEPWCSEGLYRAPPPASVLEQIERLMEGPRTHTPTRRNT